MSGDTLQYYSILHLATHLYNTAPNSHVVDGDHGLCSIRRCVHAESQSKNSGVK